jgi:hypothetical protein
MNELLTRSWGDLVGRINGPLAFRLILQPIAAAFLAIRAGLNDARSGHAAYGWAIVTDPVRRRDLLQQGFREIAKVFVVAVIIDLIYEIIVFRAIYLGQSLIVALAVALLPYILIRGPINRIVRRWKRRRTTARRMDLKGRVRS